MEDPILWRIGSDQVIKRCVPDIKIPYVLEFCHLSPFGGHYGTQRTGRKGWIVDYISLLFLKMRRGYMKIVSSAKGQPDPL